MGAWLTSGVMQEALHGTQMASERGKVLSKPWFSLFGLINIFNNGRSHALWDPGPWWAFALGTFIFSLPAVIGLTRLFMDRDQDKAISQREKAVFLLLLLTIPVLTARIIGLVVIRFYEFRYFIFCVAPYYLLVARGMTSFPGRFVRPLLVTAAIVYAVFSLRANYFVPYKEDFRDSEAYLATHSLPGDCYVVVPSGGQDAFRMAWGIYERGVPDLSFKPLSAVAGNSCSRVWLIGCIYRNFDDSLRLVRNARKQMDAQFTTIDRRSYFWITLDLYQRSSL
jgi:hypothetical protein